MWNFTSLFCSNSSFELIFAHSSSSSCYACKPLSDLNAKVCVFWCERVKRPTVNFTNVLLAAFTYVNYARSFLCLHFRFVLYWRKPTVAKAVRRMLVKLTPRWRERESEKEMAKCVCALFKERDWAKERERKRQKWVRVCFCVCED